MTTAMPQNTRRRYDRGWRPALTHASTISGLAFEHSVGKDVGKRSHSGAHKPIISTLRCNGGGETLRLALLSIPPTFFNVSVRLQIQLVIATFYSLSKERRCCK